MKIVVVGGGLVGTAVARALRLSPGAAKEVVVVEQGVPGAEASWAAGGILSPQAECDVDGPMLRLCLAGLHATWKLADALALGVSRRGVLDIALDDEEAVRLQQRVAWQRAAGLDAVWLGKEAVRGHLATDVMAAGIGGARLVGGAFFAGEGCLEPRKLFEALRAGCAGAGVTFVTGRRVEGVEGKAVHFVDGSINADVVVVCAGAWTPQVQGAGVSPAAIVPVHGQMVELATALKDAPVVYGGGGYLVARGDGRVVVGSTMEQRGFDKQLTVGGLHKVLTTATTLLPALSTASVTSTWAGLRPATPDGLPLLGRSETGVWVASGHFRNGILLAAISAERLAAAIVDDVAIDAAFSPGRFAT